VYVATRGGEGAIAAASGLLQRNAEPRSGTEALKTEQIEDQLGFLVSRVMTEGSIYDRSLAATAIRQAQGDAVEAIFLIRAYRATLSRFGVASPLVTGAMRTRRRVSAIFKDVPGGQILGSTFDYSHRLIDFDAPISANLTQPGSLCATNDEVLDPGPLPRVLDVLDAEGLIEENSWEISMDLKEDLTRQPLGFPAGREIRLQALTRGDEGFLLGLGYSTQRGFGSTHPFAGEIRTGFVDVAFSPQELDFEICIGEIELTECELVNQFEGTETAPPQFTRGYGVSFGQGERKAMSMALVDRAMRAEELGEALHGDAPAQDIEFVLSHCDSLEASGFVQHLKLPHYVDFQSELVLLRSLRDQWEPKMETQVPTS
jgi:alpha-D-ribose 1-methylphosphonate 5-triphosphate synthase subunit PhnI